MASGIWPAVSGAQAQVMAVDTVANNLANANTPAFKKDVPTFKEYLTKLEREDGTMDIPRGPIKNRDLYPLDGRDQSFVVVDGSHTDFKQGNLSVSHSPLDVALDGPGFFEVSTPTGIRYTRQGSFKLTKEGRLVTTDGHPVLLAQAGGLASALPASAVVQPGQGGQSTQGGVAVEQPAEVIARYIELDGPTPNLSIGPQGDIYAGERRIGRLGIVEFNDRSHLTKVGSQLFDNKDPANVVTDQPRTVVRQGMIETSNVNAVEEMSNLIKAHRQFEQNLKAVRTYSEMMDKEANEIGKL